MKYAVAFELSDGSPIWYAGMTRDNAFGFAPTLATAALYDTEEIAERVRTNAYGKLGEKHGTVIEVPS